MTDSEHRRNTKQRRVILEAVESLGCHPTAEEVYDEVRKVLPRTSMSTVYRNLAILTDRGEIRAVKGAGGEMHYDHSVHDHCHIQCSRCGRICDVDLYPVDRNRLETEAISGFVVEEVNIHLVGKCPDCYKQTEKEKSV